MIYFVEGIPGVGKSTYARRLYRELSLTRPTVYYKEEYKNPLDLLRQAILTEAEWRDFLTGLRPLCTEAEYRDLCLRLESETTFLGERRVIAFMHVDCPNDAAKAHVNSLYHREADDGMTDWDTYTGLLIDRLRTFLSQADPKTDYIFEGALLHNPLFTLLGFYRVGEERLISLYRELAAILPPYDYEVCHLTADPIEPVLRRTILARREQTGYSWEQGFYRWLSQTLCFRDLPQDRAILIFAERMDRCQRMIFDAVPLRRKIIHRQVEELCQM